MVRWRYCLVVALLLLLPVKTDPKGDDEDEEEAQSKVARSLNHLEIDVDISRNLNDNGPDANADPSKRADDNDDEEDDGDDDDDDSVDKSEPSSGARRQQSTHTTAAATTIIARVEKRRPLECYVCVYKSETPMTSCLDPTKYRVHTSTCHNIEDKCFTSIISKQNSYESVFRGCRSNCVGAPDTTCCELNRCNNQALAMPTPSPKALMSSQTSESVKTLQPTVLFFVTILLVLQTVARVTIV